MKIPSTFLVLFLLAGCAQSQAVQIDPTRFEADVRAFEDVAPGAVLFVGSSSIRMWETLEEDFPDLPVVNRGFGGSQFEDALHYLDELVLDEAPRTVLVYEGDNDLAAGKSAERVYDDYREFVERVHDEHPETRIGFISIKPSPSRWELAPQMREANALIEAYAERDPRLFYVDVFTPMLGPDGAPREELFLDDMLHMNPQGYAIWKEAVEPHL